MTVTINGTTGVAGVDGTASTPAIQGNDTNTGIFFPAADTIAFAEGGAEVARFDSSGNLGLGTTTPAGKLEVNSSGTPKSITSFSTSNFVAVGAGGSGGGLAYGTGTFLTFNNQPFADRGTDNNLTERMRIDSSGNLVMASRSGGGNTGQLQVGTTSILGTSVNSYGQFGGDSGTPYPLGVKGNSSSQGMVGFFDSANSVIGSISKSGSSVAYNTSSDYRLKENIAPMVGALAKVSALKPVTYTWKADGSNGQGFIAHELQAVVPDCVTGEKDAIETYTDEDGIEQTRIKPQGIDTSFLVATLTAAIQEQQAIITDLKARIETLENK